MGNCVKPPNENFDTLVTASPHFSKVVFAQKLGKPTEEVEAINGEEESPA